MNRLPEPGAGYPDGPERQYDELLELYALDMLDDDAAAEVERWLAGAPAARARLRELRAMTAMLALNLEPLEASPALRTRILDAARADLERERTNSAPPSRPTSLSAERARRRTPAWLGWAAAAALALALVGSLVWNARLRDDLNSRSAPTVYAVTSTGPAVGANGEVVVVADEGQTRVALLTLTGLPALSSGQAYQVWLIADAAPEPNVTFTPDAAGRAQLAVRGNIDASRLLAITVEPAGGSPAPTSEPLLTSNLKQPVS